LWWAKSLFKLHITLRNRRKEKRWVTRSFSNRVHQLGVGCRPKRRGERQGDEARLDSQRIGNSGEDLFQYWRIEKLRRCEKLPERARRRREKRGQGVTLGKGGKKKKE